MFSNFLKISKRRSYFSDHGADATHGCSFERFASIERICILDQLQIISSHVLYHIFCCLHMSQGQLEMVLIIQNIEQVSIERMDVLYFWEIIKDVQ